MSEIKWPKVEKAHTYASENADIYRAYDRGQEDMLRRCKSAVEKSGGLVPLDYDKVHDVLWRLFRADRKGAPNKRYAETGAEAIVSQFGTNPAEVNEELVKALEDLMDVQNGPPLITWKTDWEAAMKRASEALNLAKKGKK